MQENTCLKQRTDTLKWQHTEGTGTGWYGPKLYYIIQLFTFFFLFFSHRKKIINQGKKINRGKNREGTLVWGRGYLLVTNFRDWHRDNLSIYVFRVMAYQFILWSQTLNFNLYTSKVYSVVDSHVFRLGEFDWFRVLVTCQTHYIKKMKINYLFCSL